MKVKVKSNPRIEDGVLMAKSISTSVCGHGSLWVRLHGPDGVIFAAACMSFDVGVQFCEDAVNALNDGASGSCAGVH